MYNLYEKVPKTKECLHGSKLVEDNENPFLEGPCLLCISGLYEDTLVPESNFGVTKEGMKMARVRVRGNKNAGFSLKDFPVKFLSIMLNVKDEKGNSSSKDKIDTFFDKYFMPLISKNGQRIDCIQAMKNMRNINIMSYCAGNLLSQSLEEYLISRMKELGYTDEECIKIQSQMCMFPIATDTLSGIQKSTCISFKDINDEEVNYNVTQEERQKVLESSIGERVFTYSKNEIAYLFNGDGVHSLKKYTRVGKALPVCLSSAISKALENSIANYSGDLFIPISARTTCI